MKPAEQAELRDVIELTLVPGLGIQSQNRLWNALPEISDLFCRHAGELEALGLGPDAASALAARRCRSTAEEIIDWCRHEGCRILVRGRHGYPAVLEEIFDPPLALYAKGNIAALEKPCLAVVGTRRPTFYGLQMAQGLAFDLGQRGVVTISGLARGIDAAAHRGCLEAGEMTIAVLGCGIDVTYPREHRQLSREISEKGLVVTEFPPGTSPSPQNFPVRNRIISGLSGGTLVVEASEYSGSLITARLAMEQNREVFAIPGSLTTPQSFGPNFLIKQGAKLVQSWRDIVEEFPPDLRHKMLSEEDSRPRREENLELLTEDEIRILELLETDRAIQFDRVLRLSGMEIPRLSDLLFNLEMNGRIRQVPGSLYVKVARPGK